MQNKIVKSIVIDASIDRVWQALSDHQQFGSWFLVNLDKAFEVNKISSGKLTHPGCESMIFSALTTSMDSPTHFSFRWPHDEGFDLQREDILQNTSLVEFYLEDLGDGTRLTVTESGFEFLPEDLRLNVIKSNTGGWATQLKNIRRYLE